jgi:hypothetical protein
VKKLVFAAAMLAAAATAATAAMADDSWILHSEHGGSLTCQIPQYSLADMFRMVAEYSATVGLPQPQVDYTSAAKNGGTILHFTDPNTRNPGMIVFFASRALCDHMRTAGETWIAAGKPAL